MKKELGYNLTDVILGNLTYHNLSPDRLVHNILYLLTWKHPAKASASSNANVLFNPITL
ncbi:MAG TPA: hypothetical protein VKA95_10635 [Nitrososphaeraceae archaeon]|nr:hypothetical protein [Nitrososphaeraceae archaeon]